MSVQQPEKQDLFPSSASGHNKVEFHLQPEIFRLRQHIEELHIKLDLISSALSTLEETIDNLEQYGRRNCLLLHGMSTYPNPHNHYSDFLDSVIGKINQQLKLNLNDSCIDLAHPLQKSKNG